MEGEPKTVNYGSDEDLLRPQRGATRKGGSNPLIEDSHSDAENVIEEFHTPMKTPKALKSDEATEKRWFLDASRKKKPTDRVKKGDRYLYGTISQGDDVDRLSERLELTLNLTDDVIQLEKWILAQIKSFRDRETEKSQLRKKMMESRTQVTPGLRSGVYHFSGSGREADKSPKEKTPDRRKPEMQEISDEVAEITPISALMQKVPTPKTIGIPMMPMEPMENKSVSSKRKQLSSPGEEPITRRRKEG